MMVEIKRLIVAALATLACVGMWGCGDETEWNKSFGGAEVVGFIDDSLVIVYDSQGWHQDQGSFIQDHGDISGRGHQRLRIFNYRVQEDGPRWSDTLDNDDIEDFNYVKGQLSDSVIWGGDPKSEVSFWKIGEKPRKKKVKKIFEGCSIDVRYTTKLRPWLDGKILVMGNTLNPDIDGFDLDSLGSGYCQYAVLDTMQRTITYKKLEDDLKWIKKCDDVRAWGEDVFCLALENEPLDLLLVKNDNILDSLLQGKPYSWSKYTKVGFAGNILNLGNNVCKIVSDNFQCVGVSIRDALEYRCKDGTTIIY